MDPQFDDVLPADVFGPDRGAPMDPFDVVDTVMPIALGLFAVLFVAVVVLMIVTTTRKARRYREAGIDPLTADVERDIRLMRALENRRASSPAPMSPAPMSPAPMSPAQTLEQRLDDLERLHRSGKITSAERDAARATLLGSI